MIPQNEPPGWTEDKLETSLADLELYGLSVRTCDHLGETGEMFFVRDAIGRTPNDILALDHVGEGQLKELQNALRAFRDNNPKRTLLDCLMPLQNPPNGLKGRAIYRDSSADSP